MLHATGSSDWDQVDKITLLNKNVSKRRNLIKVSLQSQTADRILKITKI